MKKTLALLATVVIVLAGVMVVRAARMPSMQGPAPDAVAPIAVDTTGAAEHLGSAVRFRTVSYDNGVNTDTAAFRGLQAFFDSTYPLVRQHLQKEFVNDLSLLYTWEGTDPSLPPIVLMGHQDVVPVIPGTEGDWTHAPFGGEVADGSIWGRGSMDDKVSVISALEAVEALLADGYQPGRTVYLAFGHDEEIGGLQGAREIARTLQERGVGPIDLVLDEGGAVAKGLLPGVEGAVALVGIAEKGYVNLELLVEGPGGHSSTPPNQTNIGILAEAIDELEEHPFPAHFEGPGRALFDYVAPEMSFVPRLALANLWLTKPLVEHMMLGDPESAAMLRTTTAPTIIEGGVKANVLPITARAIVNFRILPGETPRSVLDRVRSVIDDDRVKVSISGGDSVAPSPVSDPGSPAFKMLAGTIRQVMPEEDVKVAPYLVMGGTDSKYYAGRSNAVFRFLAAPIGPDGLKLVHGTDEHMSVEGLATSIAFYQQLIRNADGG
ncbi:MAG: M20 family peptidase [Gemmatimonadetes bacterium]|nr:M20 family peptidase [Gemmatimonadota bacterium]